jgi:hypothetical protein
MQFYVYELIDPRDKRTFYVGKGQRNRVASHELEAAAGRVSRKCDCIREIWTAGHKVERKITQRFAEEWEAYAFEADRINEIGLHRLTNIVPGGKGGVTTHNDWSPSFLRRAAPVLARAFICLARGPKAMFGGIDLAPAITAWVSGAVEKCGIDAVADAVRPHGVEIV